MKKIALIFVSMLALSLFAQSNRSKPISINIQRNVNPAILAFVDGSIEFVEPSGNNAIDANETCMIRFAVKNTGSGDGYNCVAKIMAEGSTAGMQFPSKTLPHIASGATMQVEVPIKAAINTVDGNIKFKIAVIEPMGFGTPEQYLEVATRKFTPPLLQVVDYVVSRQGGGVLAKNEKFTLQVLVQNVEQGLAENVDVAISFPEKEGVFLLKGNPHTKFSTIAVGEKKLIEYEMIASQNYASTDIPIQFVVKERHGKYAENRSINIQLNKEVAGNTIKIDAIDRGQQEISKGTLTSAVDKNIPVSEVVNSNTFAVIIANENYMSVAKVPYALNDGRIFREYCVKTLGIPEKNIRYIADATGNQMREQVGWLQKVTNVHDNANVIFYYAGHGIPDESSRTSYLLPVDGNGTNVATGYKLDDIYAALGGLPVKGVTVFMDACFSGSNRDDNMLVAARGIAIKAKSGMPQGKMVVFSAAQGDETAYPNNDEKHGMFTYFLLKKLQDTKGDVTLLDLGKFITDNVSKESILINDKSQTPSVTASSLLGTDWHEWKLK